MCYVTGPSSLLLYGTVTSVSSVCFETPFRRAVASASVAEDGSTAILDILPSNFKVIFDSRLLPAKWN